MEVVDTVNTFLSLFANNGQHGSGATTPNGAPPPYSSSDSATCPTAVRDRRERDERDYHTWYTQHGTTLTGYVNSAKKGLRSVLSLGETVTRGLGGRVANWVLGPARPDVRSLMTDLYEANIIESRRRPENNAPSEYDDANLKARVSALAASPDAISELFDKAKDRHMMALGEVADRCPRRWEVHSALRSAAAQEFSAILTKLHPSGRSDVSVEELCHERRALLLQSLNGRSGGSYEADIKLKNLSQLLESDFRLLSDETRNKIESSARYADLISYAPRIAAYCASSVLPGPLRTLGTLATLVA